MKFWVVPSASPQGTVIDFNAETHRAGLIDFTEGQYVNFDDGDIMKTDCGFIAPLQK